MCSFVPYLSIIRYGALVLGILTRRRDKLRVMVHAVTALIALQIRSQRQRDARTASFAQPERSLLYALSSRLDGGFGCCGGFGCRFCAGSTAGRLATTPSEKDAS